MKFHDTNKNYHRIPLCKTNYYLSSNQKKSRYHFLKSNKKNYKQKDKLSMRLRKQQEEAYVQQLRKEAYEDLHATIQHYNEEFISHMRYMESSSSTTSSDTVSEEEDFEIEQLVELFEAGSVKDYSQLIEYESCKNPPQYFECQGEYGDLW